jgi:hypothetical protein
MANPLATALAVLVFIAILIAWNFLSGIWTSAGLNRIFPAPEIIPVISSTLVFIGAIVAAYYVYSSFVDQ